MDLKQHIRHVPGFPKPGILFYDISTLLAHAKAWHATIERMADALRPYKPDVLAGVESRGFLLAAPLALALNTGFVMMRKQGKLPGKTLSQAYTLEYGEAVMEIHEDAIAKGEKVIIVDDLIATGGTVGATVKLVERLGANLIECAFVVELPDLKGRDKIPGCKVFAITEFEGE